MLVSALELNPRQGLLQNAIALARTARTMVVANGGGYGMRIRMRP
jgi:hypothetical protein